MDHRSGNYKKLEREFLLSGGGGLHLDGLRFSPERNAAYLFVCLGGTGADALLRLKNEVRSRMQFIRERVFSEMIGFFRAKRDPIMSADRIGVRFGNCFRIPISRSRQDTCPLRVKRELCAEKNQLFIKPETLVSQRLLDFYNRQ